jgi:hypothetical protein
MQPWRACIARPNRHSSIPDRCSRFDGLAPFGMAGGRVLGAGARFCARRGASCGDAAQDEKVNDARGPRALSRATAPQFETRAHVPRREGNLPAARFHRSRGGRATWQAYRAILILAASLSCEKNGTAIDEILAIRRHLGEACSAAPPLGTTPKERARVTIRERPRRKASRP